MTDSAPLTGIKVVDMTEALAGPYCAMLLADFGADVVKVEPPEGDAMRQWPPVHAGYSENFASINRGKRSVALDLKDPGARDFARRLVLEAEKDRMPELLPMRHGRMVRSAFTFYRGAALTMAAASSVLNT